MKTRILSTKRRLATTFGLAGLMVCLAFVLTSVLIGAHAAPPAPAPALEPASPAEPLAMSVEPAAPAVDSVISVKFTAYTNCDGYNGGTAAFTFSIAGTQVGQVDSANPACNC